MMAGERRTLRLLVTGGGTGGHTYPALTTVMALRDYAVGRGFDFDVLWVGTESGLEARVSAEHGIPFRAIKAGKLRRSPNLRELATNVADMFRVPIGVLQAFGVAARYRPDVVLSTGGYVCVPLGVASRLLGRPLVMHEQITALGLANRILSRFARRIALTHPSSIEHLPAGARERAVVTGNPIRPHLLRGNVDAARRHFGLAHGFPLVYVTGGAQGSRQINTLIEEILPALLTRAQVIHQCGPDWIGRFTEAAAALPAELRDRYRPVAYVGGELPHVFAAADVVVSRSGAGTVAELTAVGKASVLIPLVPSAADEQRQNARYLAEAGAARALLDDKPTADRLLAELDLLLRDPATRAAMAGAAQSLGRVDAADALAQVLLAEAEAVKAG
ncbi:UDP-N-acetylglucosamine--N-acetylmuramyl-(pentapeptide) pyrophosphoryl-undecaprenol N-acetylglucosamine transferase [Streptosporangium becharense]|uniref:UDP-N-acetylglucosamine--N-acetylmuramyl-(pentapeptide) pyrophosphoryl-undecaprenol N-acetylglucosamine transferase n=1 Tax=Streptosporangium becharense TaxID=1816182 RepID=A0A7W9IBB9_9ACTN|nr:UDP-N-acetylglucosamine--N-acetylmuramyl-(pentapeptide) pyrophosphoryl-undecaprenol N-acetylglucosamine transferase [Streptosporangium becharense]MBB2910884.1 UDP-N-acetylglucosamine--N-acetylmuramyl-(pentapeptide) pyrophosphoryl-undecaprenol N-acetylglucosamine transferase [Streptosporangium becharense]MBB5817579.1 UDP-N-acetylglucosamine--N-acetylmuramyl-(pentapeptide) pyrophosphoryl-undecaprenol N-acetylglucosamine transferase [Streptosporangium becharense]